jgi:hypothetical protein
MNRKRLMIGVLLVLVLAVSGAVLTGQTGAQDNSKYGKYIVTEPAAPPVPAADQPAQPANIEERPKDMIKSMTYLDEKVVKGAYYTEVSWIMKAYPDKVWVKEHAHGFDEVFGFYGSDPSNPKDLGGEIEIYIDGEKHTLTTSCLIFVPKNTKHCPLTIKRVDKPILMFTSGPSAKYDY